MASENTRKWAIIPEPNSMTVGEGTVLLPYAGRVNESIAIGDGDFLLAHQLVADIRSATGTDWDIATGDMWSGFIRLRIADSRDFDSQDGGTAGAYTLTINTDGITITGCDFEGVRNGVQTLRQLIRQNGAVLPELQIADAPACQIRGYYLDATRGRVPTLAWLKQWADKLCLYKYNQLQLYIEHTFAFDGMSETWRGSTRSRRQTHSNSTNTARTLASNSCRQSPHSDTNMWRCARRNCANSANSPKTQTGRSASSNA